MNHPAQYVVRPDGSHRRQDDDDVFPAGRVVVIGPEPDAAYERAALTGGAGAWLSSDRVGEDLSSRIRSVLGSRRIQVD